METKQIQAKVKQSQTKTIKKKKKAKTKIETKLGCDQIKTRLEVENGILGLNRDVLMRLIELMTFKNDSLVRNLIGISGESVCWINHFHFTIARTFVERHIIPSKRKRGKEISIKLRNIMFNLSGRVGSSILINILIKNTILECTFKISNNTESYFRVGICTPQQVNNVVVDLLGKKGCGASFCFNYSGCFVLCSGIDSRYFKEGIKNEEEITAVVNNKNVNNKEKEGKMNIIRNQKRVPHTIVNIPTKDGVHLGFSCLNKFTLSIISLTHIVLPPLFNDGMRCIGYNFLGGFEPNSFDHKDEEEKEIPNIREYYNL